MSGGHWGYLAQSLEEAAENPLVELTMRFMAEAERTLDWGHSGDTCLRCARRRTLHAIDRFFDNIERREYEESAFISRDSAEEMCTECLTRASRWIRREDAKPTLEECATELQKRQTETSGYV